MMRKILAIGMSLLLALFVLSCGQETGNSETQGSQPLAENLQKVSLEVDGMTCSGCEYNVESAIKKIAGVTSVKADHEGKSAEITFDPEVADVRQFVEAVNGIGYSAKKSRLN